MLKHVLTLLSVCSLTLLADQVTMENGDRFTGKIIRSDAKGLTIKSEYAGEITVPWKNVTAVKSAEPVSIGLSDGQLVVGKLETEGSDFKAETKDAGTVNVLRENVQFIRSQEEQKAVEQQLDRYRNPRLVDLWTGFVDFGFAQTKGNADTSTVTTSANALRTTTRDKITVSFTSLNARTDTKGLKLTTANAIRGGVGYNLNVTPKMFAFASTDLEFDEFQSLDLRFVPAGGFGYRAVASEKNKIDIFGGASMNREFFSTGLRRTSAETLFGQEINLKLNSVTTLRERLVFYPNMTDTGEYRINFDTSAVTNLNKWLGWQVTISNRYLSNPVAGRKSNDILFTTGVRLTFKDFSGK